MKTNTYFSRNEQDALSYLKSSYFFDGEFNSNNRGYSDKNTFERKSSSCDCGESDAIWVYGNDTDLIEIIIICESCYDNSDRHYQI